MDVKEARGVLKALEKRAGPRLRLDPETYLFGPQRAFVQDQSKLKLAVCSRRAGKSHGIAFDMSETALQYEREIIPYITLTRDTAKNIIWPALHDINRTFDIGMEFKENTGDIVFPNKARIVLRGCDDRTQIEKLRGPRYPKVFIDEAQAFGYFLHELIDDVLEPATIDFNGQISVTGTPNAACRGPFYDMAQGDMQSAWSQHNWTLRENPHLGDVEAWLDGMMKRRNWTPQHPTYLREYCGLWVKDSSGLVYKVKEELNLVDRWDPQYPENWEYILGIDLGFNNPSAFVVLAFNDKTGQAVVIESYKESGLIPSALAVHVEKLMQRYEFNYIVADAGGFGKGYVEELREKYFIPVEAAEKQDKVGTIELMNGDLQSAALSVVKRGNEELWDELTLLQWRIDRLDRGKFEEDTVRFANHLCDALLYAWRRARHHYRDYEEEAPKVGTDAYAKWYAEQIEKMDEEAYLKELQGDDWFSDTTDFDHSWM